MCLLTIIVPITNSEKSLNACISSLVHQTYPETEILLVNAASTDTSGKICSKWAKEREQIRVLHTDSPNPAAAANAGLAEAKGKYIQFARGFDKLDLEMTQKLYDALTSAGAQIAVCGYIERGESQRGTTRKPCIDTMRKKSCTFEDFTVLMKYWLTDPLISACWNKLYDADIIREQQITFREDMEDAAQMLFNYEYFRHADTYAVVNELLYNYYSAPPAGYTTLTRDAIDERWALAQDAVFPALKTLFASHTGSDDSVRAAICAYMLVENFAYRVGSQEKKENLEWIRSVGDDAEVADALSSFKGFVTEGPHNLGIQLVQNLMAGKMRTLSYRGFRTLYIPKT